MGGRSRDWAEKGRDEDVQIVSYKSSRRDVTYTIGNTVSNTVTAMCGARWVGDLFGGALCKLHECAITMLYA